MPIPKGQTNNPDGRPKGVPNKVTQKTKGIIANIIKNDFNTLSEDIASLEPKERLEFFIKLLPFVIPRRAPENEEGQAMPSIQIDIAQGVDLGKLLGE
jgi:hypothetical protein